jgi:hypothetical protein
MEISARRAEMQDLLNRSPIRERNKSAAFDYGWWSLRGDFKMLGLALTRRIADEVARLT